MTRITIEEAQAKLPKLIDQLAPGEGLVITRDSRPIA
jgi:antitoxin (DNA-binding transcriptional repressor) of toxin-antitoxin stability system